MKIVRFFLASLLAVAATASARGEESAPAVSVTRPVNSSYMLSAGSSHLADSYLSAVKYVGWHTDFDYERMQAMKFSPDRWRQQLMLGVLVDGASNPAGNATMYYASLSASWGMFHRWMLPYNITLAAGGTVGGNFGATYNARNSNNPASVKADVELNLAGYATWKHHLGRLPFMLMWQTSMPLTGAFFTQEYDELYYEIYLGNHRNLFHWGWPGNMFRWNNLVAVDLDFGNNRLRLGFRSNIYSTAANNLVTRIFSYSFVLGVTGDWMALSPRHGLTDMAAARVAYAY